MFLTLSFFSQQAEHQVIDVVPAVSTHVHQEAIQQLPEEKQKRAGTLASQPVLSEAQLRNQNNKGQMLKHINFWHEDELKMAHPEVQVPSLLHAIHTVAICLLHFETLCIVCLFELNHQHIGLHSRYSLFPTSCDK